MKSYILTFTAPDMPAPVWRRVIMPAGATFNRLHAVIQHVMDLTSCSAAAQHPFFEIEVGGLCITDDPVRREALKGNQALTPKQPTRLKIDDYLKQYNELQYIYGGADGCRILVRLEDAVDDYHFGFPTLLSGEGELPDNSSGPYDKAAVNAALKSVKYQKTEWDRIDHVNHQIISDRYREAETVRAAAPRKELPRQSAFTGDLPPAPVELPAAPKAETAGPAAVPASAEDEELEQYIRAMVNLYGFAEAEHVAVLYNGQNGKSLAVDELLARVASGPIESRLKQDVILLRNGHFLGPKLARINPDQFFKEIAGKPYYEPPKEQLLRYADPGYYDKTAEIVRLEELLREEHVPQLQIDRILHQYMRSLSVWHADFMEAVTRLMAQAGPLTEETVNRLMPAAVSVSNAVRLIENRGFTPQELHKLEQRIVKKEAENPSPKAGRVGRNDPCPCGSGKKYKKCCGK